MAARQPHHPALKLPRGRTREGRIDYLALSFAELDAEVDAWAARLAARGVRRGDRVLVMVKQGLPLIAAAFALFKLGAVPVIIDPGMGRENFLACVRRSRPRVLLGVPLAQFSSLIFRSAFATIEVRLWVSGSATARLSSDQPKIENQKSKIVNSDAADLAAILFTSGSTGAPKGVCYEHGLFDAQVRLVRDTYGIQPGEVDLPLLPIFALFNPALGLTTIVPEIDPRRPATVDPAKIVQAIQQENVTNSFGSPTLWRIIAAHCHATKQTLPSLRRVLMAGAPAPPALFAALQPLLPDGTAHSPYGATEALPVCSISAAEVLGRHPPTPQTPTSDLQASGHAPESLGAWILELGTSAATAAGHGTCVGRPVREMEIKIIAISDDPVATLDAATELPAGTIGEIIVRGPVVTKTYDALPDATALAKISGSQLSALLPADGRDKPRADSSQQPGDPRLGGSATVWHRMGDLGYLDPAGRLWFCGRKAERVETTAGPLYTEQCEPIFNAHPSVARTALIGVGTRGRQRAAIVAEPRSLSLVVTPKQRRQLAREMCELAAQYPHTARIRHFFIHPAFPVDVRHNAKIHRLALARWASTKRAYEMDLRKDAAKK
ncbi:MAG: AMP-binding protein [Opitutae bacterium]|nr:AMP-binding protein [Opitutae bacterium]